MWPFSKKCYPPKAYINIPDSWSVFEGDYEGTIMIASFNAGARKIAGHPEYAYQVGIAIPFLAKSENGLPSSEESVILGQIEDALLQLFTPNNESIFVGRITNNNMREFVLYTSNCHNVKQKYEALKQPFYEHKVQMIINADPKWHVYRQFIK